MKTFCVLLLFFFAGISACSKNDNDATIKADLSVKAKAELDFVGVHFTVRNGVVTLIGNCATRQALDKVYTTAKKLYGVDSVINNITIAPVTIGTDWLLKQAVDSILMKYPGVAAITLDSTVFLKGKIDPGKKDEMVALINGLHPRHLEQHLETY